MSIKYLGDNQLNQIQNNPNDTPWAKLIAQSEMLERSKMRQPQGQYPQGTVAGNIQQQLLNDQAQQYNRAQNIDADKARMLAELIGSGQITGMAPGGVVTSPYPMSMDKARYRDGAKQAVKDYLASQQVPDTVYREILSTLNGKGMAAGGSIRGFANEGFVQAQPPTPTVVDPYGAVKPKQPMGTTQYALAPTKDPNEQTKKHDVFQRLLDQSIVGAVQGKANLNDTLQLYSDMFTGKALQGLAEGGDVRGFSGQTDGSFIEQLQRIKSQLAQGKTGWTPEAIANYKSAYTPDMIANMRTQGLNPAGQPLGMSDVLRQQSTSGPSVSDILDQLANQKVRADINPRTQIGGAIPPEAVGRLNPERVGPPRGAAMSSPEAQAYLRDPSFIGNATPASEYVGPKTAAEVPSLYPRPNTLSPNAVDSRSVQQFANQMVDRPEAEYSHPELRSKLQSAFGLPEGAGLTSLGSKILPNANDINEFKSYISNLLPNANRSAVAGAVEGSPAQVQQPSPTSAPNTTAQTKPEIKQSVTKDNASQIAAVHGYTKQVSPLLDKAAQAAALDQTEQAITQTGGDDMAELLHKRLKDADVDYMELAKRISENEKDLAQERKDGTLTAVLAGVGAALSRAGTLEQKGDRVFTPGIGQILGSGILGGVEQSEASEKKYRLGVEKNLDALAALQGLKRATSNDLMDAYTAERQSKVNEAHFKAVEQAERDKLNQYLIPSVEADKIRANASLAMANNRGTTSSLAEERLSTQQYNSLISRAQKTLDALTKQGKMAGDPEYDNVAGQIAFYQSKLGELTPAGVQGDYNQQTQPLTIPEGVKVTRRQG